MKSPSLRGRVWLVAALLLLMTGLASAQAAFNFGPGGFSASNVCASTPASQCQILTNMSPYFGDVLPTAVSGGILRLNSATANQPASAWYSAPVPLNTRFTTGFQFTISGCSGGCGDGMAFVIQGHPAGAQAIGYMLNGHNISYGNEDNPGGNGPNNAISNSLAVELDTYRNAEYGDPDANHIAVQSCGPNAPNSVDHSGSYVCPNNKSAQSGLAERIGCVTFRRQHAYPHRELPAAGQLPDGVQQLLNLPR